MTQGTPKTLAFFVAITLVIAGVIGYLGFRTLEHETLLRQYQQQALAQTRLEQVATFINGLLQQKATRLSAIADFMQIDEQAITELLEKDGDITDIFVLQKNHLLYPDERQPLSQREQAWVSLITPLTHDPSLLYSYSEKTEQSVPDAGWLIINESQEPTLLYWKRQGDRHIGFRVAYITLMSDVINSLHIDVLPDIVQLKENGRLLYQSSFMEQTNAQPLARASLPYPLGTWQIEYYAQSGNHGPIYAFGSLLLLLIVAAVAFIMLRLYREYTHTARTARQQVNFVSQVSHELKTPLTNIALYAELLREELDDDQENAQRYTGIITSESQRLSRLIQNILSFTRSPKVHIQPVDINQLLGQVVHTFTPSLQGKGMVISLEIPRQITFDSDKDRLTQIISNFLSNAEKYATQGKRVDIRVEAHGDLLDIHVRDYGEGIAEKETRAIFQPFYRIRSSITEGVSGTGLGLTIAQQLAHSLDGEILVTPAQPGVCFTLRLKRPTQERQP